MAGNALDSSGKIKLVAQNVETCGKNDMEEKCHEGKGVHAASGAEEPPTWDSSMIGI